MHLSYSVVLVWLHIIRFSFSKTVDEEQSLILVLVISLVIVYSQRPVPLKF